MKHREFHHLEKARAALSKLRAAGLKIKREIDLPVAVYVVRNHPGYGWEHRRYGGIVIRRGQQRYSTFSAAQAAGEQVLHAQ